ncbi:carbohydrate kinase family protein [Neolewinella persica]|uniref:carbohydrate kinase family protein n=1 Tax=Neolewinella persica TaxID=70998 RepID=UPI000367FB99|nr:PfkB family carbohydrate kinase [Neolewinella persica]
MPEIIAAGELLIDLISTEYTDDFRSADTYQRLPGGSPANLAMNLARLGRNVGLVATVGHDDAGGLLIEAVKEAGVDTTRVNRVAEPTTLILVTKSRAVSDFEPYRLADRFITAAQLDIPSGVRIFHTTAFALSKEPARSAILNGMEKASEAGVRLSVDFNYADKIWASDREAGLDTLTKIAAAGGLIKVSEVDFERLFGGAVTDNHAAAQRIMDLGAHLVCLTLGEEGCYVMHQNGAFYLPARKVEVKDTTGAGDAFWSGFLAAHLGGHDWEACARAGRGMAELKLGTVGPLTHKVSLEELLG